LIEHNRPRYQPQPDNQKVAEPKKQFYKRFLYEPFPVESSLADAVSAAGRAEGGGVCGVASLCLV
jgi:hypothetical protein